MDKSIKRFSDLEASGVFSDRASKIEYLILLCIYDSGESIGAWEMRALLYEAGVNLSSATIGRYLKELDRKGFTAKKSNKGRYLTDKAVKYLEEVNEEITSSILHKDLQKAVRGVGYQELIDIYTVRIGIENVSVRLCCRNARNEEIEEIGKSAAEYKSLAEDGLDFVDNSLDFHVLIAKYSHNIFMEKVLSMLIFEQKRIENMLEVLSTRNEGILYSSQHREIYKAIRKRDEELAAKLMDNHFAAIIETLENK